MLTTLEAYDPAANSWAARAPMPIARTNHAFVAAADGALYAFGGESPGGAAYGEIHRYDPVADTWSTREWTGTRHSGPAAAAPNGRIYMVAESAQESRVLEYDPAAN